MLEALMSSQKKSCWRPGYFGHWSWANHGSNCYILIKYTYFSSKINKEKKKTLFNECPLGQQVGFAIACFSWRGDEKDGKPAT